MSATNLYINWSAVGFTPSGGSLATILKVTSVSLGVDSDVERFKGDIDKFHRAIATPSLMRVITVQTGDVKAALTLGLTQGAQGAFTATLSDALNGTAAAGGGITVALAHCVLVKVDTGGDHAKFAGASLTFEGFALDGVTDPLSVTAL